MDFEDASDSSSDVLAYGYVDWRFFLQTVYDAVNVLSISCLPGISYMYLTEVQFHA